MVDAVTLPVPDLDQGLAFYRDRLGHELIWRNEELGQAGLRLPDSEGQLRLGVIKPGLSDVIGVVEAPGLQLPGGVGGQLGLVLGL